MTDPTDQSRISDETAMLIERAVRGEISPDDRARLDELVSADPLVAAELERAGREEDAMNTAAMLFAQRSDPERMRMAIEQKLKFDRRGLRMVAGGFIAFVVIFSLVVAKDRWPWGVLAPISLCLIWWLITEKRLWSLKRTSAVDDEAIVKAFNRHLSRSRMAIGFNRAVIPLLLLVLVFAVIDLVVAGSYGKAGFVLAFGFFLLSYGWKYLYNSEYQKRYDQFLQGRLTIEELFDKRAESAESDGE